MVWQVKALVAKPDDLSLIPETQVIGEESQFCKLSSDLYMRAVTYIHHGMCAHTLTYLKLDSTRNR